MLKEIQRDRPNLEAVELSRNSDMALELWQERGALTDPEKLTEETCQLMREMAGTINSWDQDTRDAALSLIQALAARTDGLPILDSEQQALIGATYIEVVDALVPSGDWLGAPWTAMELGQNVAKILGKETDFVHSMRLRGKLAEKWSNYVAHASFDNLSQPFIEKTRFNDSFRKELDKLQKTFLSRDAEAAQAEEQRNGPENLNESATELTIWYGQSTKQGASAKLAVLRATPKYQELLRSNGIELANFWNLNKPAAAAEVLEVVLSDPLAAPIFKNKFILKTGSEFDELDEAEKAALTDLNINLARDVYVDLYNRRSSFDETYSRIMTQVEQARTVHNPKKKLKPVLNWIRQISPDFSTNDPAEVASFIASHSSELQSLHDAKHSAINEFIDNLGSVLPVQSRFVRFMDRSLFDLKSANLTGDCTAWNLEAGVNAWTVPVWVTNPAFNFAYIYSGNTIAAKFGLILATSDEGAPRVIIDSIETNKNLPEHDHMTALEAIYAGFRELQQWADSNGYGTLQVCTFTNSQELTANLPIVKDIEAQDEKLKFDGLLATQEVMQQIRDGLKTPQIYLQSAEQYLDDDDELVYGEFVSGAAEFEEVAKAALEAARNIDGGSLISENGLLAALRSGEKDAIANALIEALVPQFARAFYFDYDALAQLYTSCVKKSGGGSIDGLFKEVLSSYASDIYFDDDDDEDLDYSYLDDPDEPVSDHLITDRSIKNIAPILHELAPKNLECYDQSALNNFLETFNDKIAKYSHILNILDKFIGLDKDESIDIAAAARFVYGAERDENAEQVEGDDPHIIPLGSMPQYDRREMDMTA